MASREPHHVFTYEEYLARERETGLRHEFLEGAIYAMAGGTPEHARLIGEVTFAIRSAVDPARCRVFPSDLKVQVAATGLTTYPDVALVCGDLLRASGDENAVTNPKLLVEVLSSSTEAYDRGEKWAHYRRIESLEAYVLVGQIPQRVEVYEKQANGEFVHRVASRGEQLTIVCAGVTLDVDAVYRAAL
jgi:Uma2 family endonuclease